MEGFFDSQTSTMTWPKKNNEKINENSFKMSKNVLQTYALSARYILGSLTIIFYYIKNFILVHQDFYS